MPREHLSPEDEREMFAAFRRPTPPEPRMSGCLSPFLITDGHDIVQVWQLNMLNALRTAGVPWTEYVITEHSAHQWTCVHPSGFAIKVRAKYATNLAGRKLFFTGREYCIDTAAYRAQGNGTI